MPIVTTVPVTITTTGTGTWATLITTWFYDTAGVTIRVPDETSLFYPSFANIPPPTEEQQRHREEIQARYEQDERERRERLAQRQVATRRARETLMALLGPENRRSLENEGLIRITGSHGGRYQIHCGNYSGNVVRLDRGWGGRERRVSLCAHPPMRDDEGRILPIDDVVIGQMFHLLTDEPGFLRIANVV